MRRKRDRCWWSNLFFSYFFFFARFIRPSPGFEAEEGQVLVVKFIFSYFFVFFFRFIRPSPGFEAEEGQVLVVEFVAQQDCTAALYLDGDLLLSTGVKNKKFEFFCENKKDCTAALYLDGDLLLSTGVKKH